MKILFLVIAILGSVFSASGQLEVSLNDNSGFTAEDLIRFNFSVSNLFPVDTFFHWAIETSSEAPTEWRITSFYDVIICYAQGFTSSTCGEVYRNYIETNSTQPFLQFRIKTEDTFEDGCITLHLLSDCVEVEHDTMVSHTFKFNKDWPTNLEEVHSATQLQLYPNPVIEQIYLSNDAMVNTVTIFNAQGMLVDEGNHVPGQAQDVSHLENGSYFLEMKDALGKTLDLLRFVKVE